VPIPDPARRSRHQPPLAEDLPSALRPPGFRPPPRRWQAVAPGHLVRVEDAHA
jgi:hypothetical protein